MAPRDATMTAVVAADGTATVIIKPTNGFATWVVSQVSVELPTAPVGATCEVRKNGYLVSLAIPTGDSVAGDPPVILLPSDQLTVKWSGCTQGDTAKVLAFYDDGSPA